MEKNKWLVRVILHFVSFALCNSWLRYIRDANNEPLPKKSTLDLLASESNVASSIVACNKAPPKKRGRLSNKGPQVVTKKLHNAQLLPTNTPGYDGSNHWCHWAQVLSTPNTQCTREGYTSKIRVRCCKCGILENSS